VWRCVTVRVCRCVCVCVGVPCTSGSKKIELLLENNMSYKNLFSRTASEASRRKI